MSSLPVGVFPVDDDDDDDAIPFPLNVVPWSGLPAAEPRYGGATIIGAGDGRTTICGAAGRYGTGRGPPGNPAGACCCVAVPFPEASSGENRLNSVAAFGRGAPAVGGPEAPPNAAAAADPVVGVDGSDLCLMSTKDDGALMPGGE